MAQMKVIFVLHSHKAGGAERHLLQLMQGTSRNGVECIYAGPSDGWLGEQAARLGFRCAHIPYHGFFDILSLVRLSLLVRREKADLVHGHLTRGAFYAGWAGQLTKTPVVATAHSTNAGKHFGKAKRIIAVSDAVKTFLLSRGYAPDIVRTVHHGVPDYAQNAMPLPEEYLGTLHLNDGPTLVMVARFVKDKGHDIALQALAKLRDRPWNLLLAGAADNMWANEMKRLASQLGIQNRVHFIGHRDDVPNVYASADMLLAPSRREALSLTLLEAAAFCLPIVATDVGGIGEAVENGKTGLLTSSENYEELAESIARLLDSPALRKKMGDAGRHRYEKFFSLDRMAKSTIAIYQEAITRK
ncbi:MAG: glycosyltransferase family 1 protein [Oxalobacter sp.]|nr:MAG: glycosyltransferase family 1 protein [Oxalobacter sp.]